VEARLAAHLADRYRTNVDRVVRLEEGVYRVERTGAAPWVARVFPPERPAEHLEGDADVLQTLAAHDYPAERCADEEPVSGFDDETVIVTEHCRGTVADGRPETGRRLGALLGRLHTLPLPTGRAARTAGALHHFTPGGGPPSADVAAAQTWMADVEDRVRAPHRELFDSLVAQLAGLGDDASLPRAFVHPDFHRGNAIESPAGEHVVIDWTGAGVGARVASLGLLLFTAAAKAYPGDPASATPDVARVDPVIAGYREHVRLDDEELDALEDAVLRPGLVLTCFLYSLGVRASGQPMLAGPMRPRTDLASAIAQRAREAMR
jgi:Ser/Thr protein kinase RdoA (MazF antagonist)